MMITLTDFLSVAEYAKRCGVQSRAVYKRIKHQKVAAIKVGDIDFIDITHSPPSPLDKYNPKQFVTPAIPDTIKNMNLVWVKHYAKLKKVSMWFVYEQLILGKYNGVIIGEKIFVDTTSINEFRI